MSLEGRRGYTLKGITERGVKRSGSCCLWVVLVGDGKGMSGGELNGAFVFIQYPVRGGEGLYFENLKAPRVGDIMPCTKLWEWNWG